MLSINRASDHQAPSRIDNQASARIDNQPPSRTEESFFQNNEQSGDSSLGFETTKFQFETDPSSFRFPDDTGFSSFPSMEGGWGKPNLDSNASFDTNPSEPVFDGDWSNSKPEEKPKKDSAWKRLNSKFLQHIEDETKNAASDDWSTAMSEYLSFAHKLNKATGTPPAKAKTSNKKAFKLLNSAFASTCQRFREDGIDKDWTPTIRDYINYAEGISAK